VNSSRPNGSIDPSERWRSANTSTLDGVVRNTHAWVSWEFAATMAADTSASGPVPVSQSRHAS